MLKGQNDIYFVLFFSLSLTLPQAPMNVSFLHLSRLSERILVSTTHANTIHLPPSLI
eukprot:m.49887 g.49887  ORF g.49887 m.49887 type:complete len:57 (-) comp11126_c1_seq1:37-207(-)